MYVFVFAFGLGVGSFLNAVIYRLEVGDSAFRGRSYCPQCKHTLAWYDLIPLASFVLLGGKCRYCEGKISWQYPIVELSTAAIFTLVFWHLGFEFYLAFGIWTLTFLQMLYLWTIAALLIVLFVYDLKHYILPDKILFPAIASVFVYNFGFWIFDLFRISDFGFRILSALAAAAFFFAIFALSRGRAMGFGDVKLALFMGLFLGWPNVAVAMFAAFLAGAAIGLVLIAAKKKGMKSEIPFGPFLIAGTFAALFWGKLLVDWYLNLLLV